MILVAALCIFIYWMILILIFEKERKSIIFHINENELFEKYNPMVAGCIEGSRGILARDIIAVILNLINKKNINLEFQYRSYGKEIYTYYIKKNPEKENEMDDIERYL